MGGGDGAVLVTGTLHFLPLTFTYNLNSKFSICILENYYFKYIFHKLKCSFYAARPGNYLGFLKAV